MKKSISVLLLALLMSVQSFERPWWSTALIDAGAGFVGAGQGAEWGAKLGTLAGNPVAGAVAGGIIGGLLVGAGASCAANDVYNLGTTFPTNYTYTSFPNPGNAADYMGIDHNQLLRDVSNTATPDVPWNVYNYFVGDLPTYYNSPVISDSLPFDTVNNIESTILTIPFNNATDVYNFLVSNSVATLQPNFKAKLNRCLHNILGATSIRAFDSIFIQNEDSVISDTSLHGTNQFAFETFFSILRNSANFWAENNAGAPNGANISGVNNIQNVKNIEAYPNPANNELTLNLTGINGKVNIVLYSVTGQQVLSMYSTSQTVTFPVTSISPGLYLIKVQTEDGSIVEKNVVIER